MYQVFSHWTHFLKLCFGEFFWKSVEKTKICTGQIFVKLCFGEFYGNLPRKPKFVLDEFSWNYVLESFVEICRESQNLYWTNFRETMLWRMLWKSVEKTKTCTGRIFVKLFLENFMKICWENQNLYWTDFRVIMFWRILWKSVEKTKIYLKWDKISGTSCEYVSIFDSSTKIFFSSTTMQMEPVVAHPWQQWLRELLTCFVIRNCLSCYAFLNHCHICMFIS
jgi:hypothetical protein